MSLKSRSVFIVMISLLLGLNTVAQEQWPNSLLWRITGNGLQKPSYLFGTMHLQDKRLFNFGDSMYQSISSVEGFALEVNFKDLMDSIFTKQFQNAEENFLDDREVSIDRKKMSKTGDSLLNKFGIKGDKITRKDLKKIRDYRMKKIMQQGEMQTIVDGYLYGLALRQHKWTGGIEDINDQMDVMDEFGGGLSPDEVLQSEASMKKSIEEMISIYVKQDLQLLYNYCEASLNGNAKDILLVRRNIKMAKRMDSLSAIRTMFFAIGAAHLPGDSGVISLLRKRGFNLEPVYSSKKIHAENYIKSLENVSWTTVVDEEKVYSIQMPGKPSEFNMLGQAFKMKLFFDLTTMTIYMTGHTLAGGINIEDNSDKIIKSLAENMGVKTAQIKSKNIIHGNSKGIEGSFTSVDGSYKVQLLQKNNTLFLLLAGSPRKLNLGTPDISHFFSSFIPNESAPVKKDWVKLELKEKAFSIMLPAQFKLNKVLDKQSDGTNWYFTTYDAIDNTKGIYYLFQVRDIRPGFYLNGDSAYFAIHKANFKEKFDSVSRAEQTLYKGFPAFYMDAGSTKDQLLYKTFYVIRGNRVYAMLAGGGMQADFSDISGYFNSLEIQPYIPSKWETYRSDGFFTSAPAPLIKIEKDTSETNTDTRDHYVSYNSNQAISYEVFKEIYPPFYWTSSDSIFLENITNEYKLASDSLIQFSKTKNGKLKGVDLVIQEEKNHNLKKIRFFLNGDTVYTLISYHLPQFIDDSLHKKFFDDFRVVSEVKSTLFTNKAVQLMTALKSNDSTAFEKAVSTFNMVTFTSTDLPHLHHALLQTYREQSEGSPSITSKIAGEISKLADTSTISFINRNYQASPQEVKYTLLRVLADNHTLESYQVLKKLLLSGPPEKGKVYQLEHALRDTLELTRTLFPEVLALSNHPVFSNALVGITSELMDNDLLLLSDVKPYKIDFINQAKMKLDELKGDEEEWQFDYWIPFVARFNDSESNALLQEFLKIDNLNSKFQAIKALATNNQPVNVKEIEKVATNLSFRVDLYEELKLIKKENLFPSKYANQRSLAESDMYAWANDEYSTSAITFIGERILVFEGVRKSFFIYKTDYKDDDGSILSYLGITGPYALNRKPLEAIGDASGIYWDEQYDKQQINKQLKVYLDRIAK